MAWPQALSSRYNTPTVQNLSLISSPFLAVAQLADSPIRELDAIEIKQKHVISCRFFVTFIKLSVRGRPV